MSGQLSVVVPVHNGAKFIDRCLSSALNAATNSEIIVVENGSTDNSWETLQKWQKYDLTLFQIPESNKCLARNFGANKATRDLITFLDQDDELTEDISEVLKVIINDTNIEGVISTQEFEFEEEFIPAYFHKAYSLNLPMYHPMAFVMRRKTFLDHGGFDSTKSKAEDFSLVAKFVNANQKLVFSSAKTVKRHFHPANDSHNIVEARSELFQVIRQKAKNIGWENII